MSEITISVRPIEKGDLMELRDQRNRLMRNFRQWHLLNMINQHDWLERISRSDEHIMMCVEAPAVSAVSMCFTVGVVGLTYIDWARRNAEASIYIFDRHIAYNNFYFFATIPPVLLWNFTVNNLVTWKHKKN